MHQSQLAKKIEQKVAVTCVMGLGYVGLPEAVSFARAGYRVIGVDIDPERVNRVNAGSSYIPDVEAASLASLVQAGRLSATRDFDVLAGGHGTRRNGPQHFPTI
ncbi:MAG: hypothetical protein ACREKR_00565 [Candidatus Methylomirabilales bacterium]